MRETRDIDVLGTLYRGDLEQKKNWKEIKPGMNDGMRNAFSVISEIYFEEKCW